MPRRAYGPVALVCFALIGGLPATAQCGKGAMATAGTQSIDERDLAMRVAARVIQGERSSAVAALTGLIRESLEREVARRVGALPSAAELAVFDERARSTSRAPATLFALVELFDGDTGEFQRHVIQPRLQAIKLREHFERDQAAHSDVAWYLRVAEDDRFVSPYERWYRGQALAVPIRILDPSFHEAICSCYREVWWLKSACDSGGGQVPRDPPRQQTAR